MLAPIAAHAQVPTGPATTFVNSTSPAVGTDIAKVLDGYANLMVNDPGVLVQNYQTVITMTQNRTAAQTLKAVHDDRTAQPYSVMNGLGVLTSYWLTGAGASFSGVTPQSLTPTSYMVTSLSNYATNINYGSNASAGSATFANGAATPLASAVNFINNVVRANSSTEPPKRTFERYQGANPAINPLDPRYANYNAATNPGGLTTNDTAAFVVPSYLSSFAVPAPYANTTQWVQGFTVTQAMINANGGAPITAPNIGTFDANGNFTPTQFTVGEYVPGIGTAPRPYRVSTQVNVPGVLYQVINSTNPYADGAFPSGHTNSAFTQALGTAFLVPQQAQELLTRAADLGNDRILAGMHSPLDVIGGRMEATAIAATNIYAALYDSNGNRLDWTNPANAAAYSVYQAYTQTQAYLANACGAVSVSACLQAAQASGATANDPYGNEAANKAAYTAELTYGFQPIGPSTPLTDAQVPVQAQVLLLTRFPYLSDAQRTDVLATTGLPSGYPLLSGDTYGGWGQLNLYAAEDGYGAFNSQIVISMDASQGGYSAADSWNNNIGGTGGLTKGGTGVLTLTGTDTYTGPTIINGGGLYVTGSIVSATTVNATGLLGGNGQVGAVTVNSGGVLAPGVLGTSGSLTVNGVLILASGSTLSITAGPAALSSVVVKGAVTLSGGGVAVNANPTLPVTQAQILTASGGVSGQFGSASTPSANLNVWLGYSSTAVTLTLDRTNVSLTPTAGTPNQNAVAAALTRATPQAQTAGAAALVDGVYLAELGSPSQGRAALDSVSGEGLTSAITSAFQTSVAFTDAMRGEQDAREAERRDGHVWRIWGGPFGGGDNLNGQSGVGTAREIDSYYGGLVGIDGQITPNWLVGAALGAADTHYGVSGRLTTGTANSGFAAAYTSLTGPRSVYLHASLTLAQFNNEVSRTAGGVGSLAAESETAQFNGGEVRGRAELGKAFAWRGLALTPFVAVEYAGLHTNGFGEHAAASSSLALQVPDQTTVSLPLSAGARISGVYALGAGVAVHPYVEAAYVHEFDPRRSALVSFESLPGTTITVDGARAASNAAELKAGADVTLSHDVSLYFSFDGDLSDVQTSYAGRAGIRLSF